MAKFKKFGIAATRIHGSYAMNTFCVLFYNLKFLTFLFNYLLEQDETTA